MEKKLLEQQGRGTAVYMMGWGRGGSRASLAPTESRLYRGDSVSHAAIWARVFQIKRSHKRRA